MIDRLPFVETATQYPSIETYHALGNRGRLTEEVATFHGPVYLTEKVDGTNVRVITDSSGDYLIGERLGLLYAKGDRVANPANGVVETLRDFLDTVQLTSPSDDILPDEPKISVAKMRTAWQEYSDDTPTGNGDQP